MFSELPSVVWETLGAQLGSKDLATCEKVCPNWQEDIEGRQAHRFAFLRNAITSFLELPHEGKPPGERRICALPNQRLATLDVFDHVMRIWNAETGQLLSSALVAEEAEGLRCASDGSAEAITQAPDCLSTAAWGAYEWRVSDTPRLELWHIAKEELIATVKCTQHRAREIAIIGRKLVIVDRIGRTVLLPLPEL